MNLQNLKRTFKNQGYIKVNCIDLKKLETLKKSFAKMIEISLKKNLHLLVKEKNNSKKISYLLNEGMIKLEKKKHTYLSELYDQIVKSNKYYDLITDKKLTKILNYLLGRDCDENFYINSSSIRMDTPGVTPYIYGWHQDNKSNIKNSNFVQLWMPVFSNITKDLGGLHILEKSFLYDIKTTHNKVEIEKLKKKKILRASHDVKILDKKLNLKEKIICCDLGQAVIFNKKLMHKSGINTTKNKMRYVCNSFYHDIYNPKWKFKKLDHK
jgi:hypothetical protein